MTEKSDDAVMDVVQADSVLNSMQSTMFKELRSKQDEVLEKLKSVETRFGDQLEKIQNQLKSPKRPIKDPTLQISDEMEPAKKKQKLVDPLKSKHFVLKHIFKNVSSLKENKSFDSINEEHFGVEWHISIYRENENLGCYLYCQWPETKNKWSIEADYEIGVNGSNDSFLTPKETTCYSEEEEGYGFGDTLNWDDMEKNYLIDDGLKIEFHVQIKKTTGIYKDNLRQFDESTQDVSDIVLIVNSEKFFVSKLYLAAHSSYFKTMFLGTFEESEKSEITLTDTDPDDFQKYLELLYGESAIDETSVEGILLVADMYDTPLAIRKCEEFLVEKSKKTLKKKLLMSVRYSLESLKNKCLEEIKTIDILRSVTPVDIDDLGPSLTALLLKKSLSFQ